MSGKPAAQKPALEKCISCGKTVYVMEKVVVDNRVFHDKCFKCAHCGKRLEPGTCHAGHHGNNFYCKPHYQSMFMTKGNYSESEKSASPSQQQQQTPPQSPPPAKAAPGPPPPPADLGVDSSAPASEGGMAAALAAIATGGASSQLKHVSREDRKRPPASSVVPGESKTKEKEEKKDEKKVVKGDPVTKLDDKKWTVRFHENCQATPIVIEITSFQQSVAISNCDKAVIQIKGKCTNIAIMSCTNVGVIFDDVVASVEAVRSKKLQLQANGALAQIALDNSSSVDIFMQSAAGKSVEIVTSLCEGVNVTFPGEHAEADPTEYPIPMQFISNLKEGKLITAPSSHV